jgi:hypothetical protein
VVEDTAFVKAPPAHVEMADGFAEIRARERRRQGSASRVRIANRSDLCAL